MKKQAMFFESREDRKVKCKLCPHGCLLKEGQTGICRCRINDNGILYSENYGEIGSLALDPIEKKPLYHFYPGSLILSAGTFGCNLSCFFCQNYMLVHGTPETRTISTRDLASIAEDVKNNGSIGIAFTYNEPLIWYEYILEAAQILKEAGQKIVLVTNGFIEEKPLLQLLPFIDAMNIDVKAFTEEFYHKNCRGSLKNIMNTVEISGEYCHVEVTNLLIPGENDGDDEIDQLALWLSGINGQIPLHFSRYHPAYKSKLDATPGVTLDKAREIAKQYLDFVFVGNIGGRDNNTYCPECGNILISRQDYRSAVTGIKDARCATCGTDVGYIVL